MKKGQAAVEYLLFLVLTTFIVVFLSTLWNRNAIINGATFGVEDDRNQVHVRPMTD